MESGAWEENFKSAHDTKPNGPEAVALDFSFPQAVVAYGLPEHADSFALKSSKGSDPYRLYNLDVFEYELNSKMALYAGVPLLFAHGPESTTGVFWLNAAETWIDVMSKGDQNVLSSIVNLVSGSTSKSEIDAHFMSESGIIDVFLLMGPSPDDVLKQYASLTGTSPLPQMFSLAYHQSRWNYNDEEDVRNVVQKFDDYNLPMDAIWLDIEHADNKKYFTWDPVRFANPLEMTKNISDKGRKLVVIVDPHIKRDVGYFLHNDAEANGYYVKNPDGKDYEGWCWPGSSSYLDFLNPAVREYYSNRYLLENYKGSTLDTYIWNDMNEPSVFNGPEITMPKDVIHHGGWEHRHIHNIYGFLHTMSTYEGLLKRSEGKLRPFILTRAGFAGSQRYVSIWTGDNMAEWDHLKATIPMCLSLSISGLVLCGADVGGFFGNPEPELFARWFQAGAFQPFFRAHSHIDTKRREPWSMDQVVTDVIRGALRKRYSYLPFWYTLMYEHENTASSVMRPLWMEFPKEEAVYGIEDEYLLGKSLLVHPVTDKGATSVNVYFPGVNEVWYDSDTYEKFDQNGFVKVPVDLEKIPVFIRGGSIIPKKERIRRASSLMRDDPYTLVVALDAQGKASGKLYIDDEQSFEYREGKFAYLSLEYKNNKLISRNLNDKFEFKSKAWLERVLIVGFNGSSKRAEINHSGNSASLETRLSSNNVLTIRKPGVSMTENWEIKIM
ncbi:Neutral alpha-glucosidase AB precursor, putative [Pediculus humanus corporis]|uniref:Glucosidase II subunit alpha n=1 Tax=Pediculus humanus subsp. corporis TaxID=121224 RepID=E0VVD2_PEDHC|nr:Neutral alpha-glucosidase AB precursor, putative [Pediculus humanus corporis]EEB17338.1 Neutral alpha-glucosidase AB precursor, putative [Pediculus humanus corporis]